MRVTAQLGHDFDPDTVNDLVRWLREWSEPGSGLDGGAEIEIVRQPRAGSMSAVEIINVILTNAIALGGLAVSVAAWRDSRRPPPPAVPITVGERRVPITDANPAERSALAEAAEAAGEEPVEDGG